ncbi:MAG: T9SS type A sorting domain-containing protein [Bacteroidetes bacterium]|nr:T9SS type A sorting domain-containing protein [Bacteroidota bacterium]
MRPVTLNDNLYLPTYIEDGEQEYFSITKVSSELEILWTKYFNEDFAYSVPAELLASPDSNLYVSSNVYVEEERRYYNQLLKLDSSGKILWEYFNAEELEHGAVSPWFTTLSDSNIVVSYRVDRFTNDTFRTRGLHFTPYRLIWLDQEGNLIKKKYYVSERLKRFFINKVETGLGDYLFLMGRWEDGEASENKNLLLKLNNEGDSLWHRTYYHPDYSLDSVSFSVVDMHEFPDGRIAVLSMISTPYDWNRIWIYMVDSEGNCLTDNCISEGDVVSMSNYEITYDQLTLYPNPARDRLYWRQDISLQDVRVYDIFGRPVIEEGGEWVYSLNLSTLASGTYFLEGRDRSGQIYRGKFVKQ